MDKQNLIKFEKKVALLYEEAKIPFPIHLSGINENQLIKIFKKVDKKKDWVFSTWRSHYHWLLFGKDVNELLRQIKESGSMHIYGDRFFTSAIVGGICPIALGVALALKLKKKKNRVWSFIGDMAYSGGLAKECIQYAQGHDLPVTYVVEDNGLSVATPTKEVWGTKNKKKIIKYKYRRKYNHAGHGLNGKTTWVLF